MAKTKKKDEKASNQPSLLAFWGKKSTPTVQVSNALPSSANDEKKRAEKVLSNDKSIRGKASGKRRRYTSSTPEDFLSFGLDQFMHQAVTPEGLPSVSHSISPSRTNTDTEEGNDEVLPESDCARTISGSPTESLVHAPDTESLPGNQDSESTACGETNDKEDQKSAESSAESEDSSDEEETQDVDTNQTDPNNPDGLSDYELLRLRNIARNNERLKALGLISNVKETTRKVSNRKANRPKKQPKKAAATTALPTRRSTRLSKSVSKMDTNDSDKSNEQSTGTEVAQPDPDQTIEEEEGEMYDVSPVVQYDMEHQQSKDAMSTASPSSKETTKLHSASDVPICALAPSRFRLSPPQGLTHIYSLNFFDNNDWLVGAGKSGIVSLWNCQDKNCQREEADVIHYTEPVLSWKAHSGRWISEAKFVSTNDLNRITNAGNNTAPSRLLTAANDGIMCLWDLSQVSSSTGMPRILQRSDKTFHSSGIFAMDLNKSEGTTKIATGSKDKTIVVTTLGEVFSPVWRSDFHTKTVKAVKFRDRNVLATASDDGCVAILDDRVDGNAYPLQVLEGLHKGLPHSVVWDPDNSNVFLSAGLDNIIQAWDLRFLKQQQPFFEYYGHVPLSTHRCKRIHHPVFYGLHKSSQRFILSGGEGSHALSMFCYSTESRTLSLAEAERISVYSRGTFPQDCVHGDAGSIAIKGEIVAVSVEGGEILLLDPSSEKRHPIAETE